MLPLAQIMFHRRLVAALPIASRCHRGMGAYSLAFAARGCGTFGAYERRGEVVAFRPDGALVQAIRMVLLPSAKLWPQHLACRASHDQWEPGERHDTQASAATDRQP